MSQEDINEEGLKIYKLCHEYIIFFVSPFKSIYEILTQFQKAENIFKNYCFVHDKVYIKRKLLSKIDYNIFLKQYNT